MSEEWLRAFDPSCDALLDLLLPQIDDGMLFEIARADYGQDAEEHFAPLKLFRDERVIPTLEWHPGEVLELVRWSQPDQADWRPGGQGRYGHLLRAFACTALLRACAQESAQNRWLSFNETVVQLADSLKALGGPFVPAGVQFFAWGLERLAPLGEEGTEGPFLGLALLSLALQTPATPDEAIAELCAWIDRKVEILLSQNAEWAPRRMNWLLSFNHDNQRNKRWAEIGHEFQEWAEAQPESDKATWVALIGGSLAGAGP